HAGVFVHCNSLPAVSTTIALSGVGAPGVSAELIRLRDYMEKPFQLAGVDIEGADIAWCRRKFIRYLASHYKEIVVHHARRVAGDAHTCTHRVRHFQTFIEIDATIITKVLNNGTVFSVDGIKRATGNEKDTVRVARMI